MKLCACGCGTSVNRTWAKNHNHRGVPKSSEQRAKLAAARLGKSLSAEHRLRLSEVRRGKKLSPSHRRSLSECKLGEQNPAWRGTKASYKATHKYLVENFPKRGVCEECKAEARTDYALIRGRSYTRNRYDYRELCRPCHVRYDRS